MSTAPTAPPVDPAPDPASEPGPREVRTVLLASLIGTTIEWYDFFLFATASGLIFPKLFYGHGNPTVATLLSMATFASGFVARPVGGLIFGHIGDRLGRRATLVVTMALTGLSTAAIAVLPAYDRIGVAAPVLLVTLRVVQGLALGGEWGGAVLMAVENAPPGRRGRFGATPQIGLALGLALGTGAFALLGVVLPRAALLSYGWRIAFGASVLLVGVGLVVRLRVLETPAFRRLQARARTARLPAAELLRDPTSRRHLGRGLLVRWAEGASFNTWSVFALSFGVAAGLPQTGLLVAVTGAAVVCAVVVPLAGGWSDRLGRGRVVALGAAILAVGVFPTFAALRSGSLLLAGTALVVVLGVSYGLIAGPESTLFAELFPTATRYTGMSLVYQGGGVYASGLTPLVLTSLVGVAGGSAWLAGAYLLVATVVSGVAAWGARPYPAGADDAVGAEAPEPKMAA